MEIFVVAALLICVIICLIVVIKTEKTSLEKPKRKEYTPQFETSDEQNNYDTLEVTFRECYNSALTIAKDLEITNNVEFEVLVPIYMICEFAASEMPECEQLEITEKLFFELFFDVYPELNIETFRERLHLYGEAIKNKNIHYLWANGNKHALDDNIVSNCAAILGDIIFYPKCAENYFEAQTLTEKHAKNFVLSNSTIYFIFSKKINESFNKFFYFFYKNVVMPNHTDNIDEQNGLNQIADLENVFERHYKSMLTIAKSSKITCDAEFELLPAMYILCHSAAEFSNKDISKIRSVLIKEIFRIYPENDSAKFGKRLNLYQKVIDGKKIRYEWAFGNSSQFGNDIVSKCVGLLGDILCNPNCADDYDNAPIFIHDGILVLKFSIDVIGPLHFEFVELYKEICRLNLP